MQLVGALDTKNSSNNYKDARISQLEVTIDGFRQAAFT